MTKPRPLTADQRRRLTADLRALADELDRPDAGRIQQALAVAADDGYASTASGAGGGGGGGGVLVDTPVEAKASRVDPTVAATERLLERLRRLLADAGTARSELASWRTDRPVALCAEGHVLEDRSSSRCTWEDPETGRRCGTRKETVRCCENPSCVNEEGTGPVVLQPGQQRWRAPALDLPGRPVLAECSRCRTYRRRNSGRSWAPATRLAVPGVNELGCYVDEDPWPDEPVPSGG